MEIRSTKRNWLGKVTRDGTQDNTCLEQAHNIKSSWPVESLDAVRRYLKARMSPLAWLLPTNLELGMFLAPEVSMLVLTAG